MVPIRTAAPNDLWTADFKGQFRTRDAIYCYPLTIADQHTRFLIACHGLKCTKGIGVRRVFECAFREYGLPAAIRTDNGVPFATTGIHGLSQLNVWWMRLGIQHQRIRPASPQENGAHERMHKTLKAETIRRQRETSLHSNGHSQLSELSLTASGLIKLSGAVHPVRSTRLPPAGFRIDCHRSNTQDTSW